MASPNKIAWNCKNCGKRGFEFYKIRGEWTSELKKGLQIVAPEENEQKVICGRCGKSELLQGDLKQLFAHVVLGKSYEPPLMTREERKEKRDLHFAMDFDIGTDSICKNNDTVLFKPFNHTFKTGRQPKVVRYVFMENPDRSKEAEMHPNYILGAFGLGESGLLSFFPAYNFPINVSGRVVEGKEQPPDGRLFEHFTLELDRRSWHMTPTIEKTKGSPRKKNGTVKKVGENLYHWFSKSFSKFSDMEPLYKKYRLNREVERGATNVRVETVKKALGNNFNHNLELNDIRVFKDEPWYIQVEFLIYEGDDENITLKLPELTPVVPQAIFPENFDSKVTMIILPEADFSLIVYALMLNGISPHNSYSSFKHQI